MDVAVQVENENEDGNGLLTQIEPSPNWFQQARSTGTIDVTLDYGSVAVSVPR